VAVNRTACCGFRCLVLAAFVIIGFTWCSGCTVKKPETDPAQDKKARALVLSVLEYNAAIATSKGTGRLVANIGGRPEVYKIAWAAKAPDRLRLTLLLSGHPVETIAASGKRVTFISHTGNHTPHSTLSADPDLESYIGVPLRLSQMVSMLLGRIPVREFDRAWTSPDRPDIIHANKNFSSSLQELKTGDRGQVIRYRILDKDFIPIFGIEFKNFKTKKNFLIPTLLSFYDTAGQTLEIALTGLVPNAPVKESIFRLTGSGS